MYVEQRKESPYTAQINDVHTYMYTLTCTHLHGHIHNTLIVYTCACAIVPLVIDGFGGGAVDREEGEGNEEGEGGGWDVDDVLEIPEDIGDVGPAISGEEGYFVPPTKGTPPSQVHVHVYV